MATEVYQFKQQAFGDMQRKRRGNMFSSLRHTGCRDHPEVFSRFIPGGKAAGMLTRQTISIRKLTT
jgi:hypothetical protein